MGTSLRSEPAKAAAPASVSAIEAERNFIDTYAKKLEESGRTPSAGTTEAPAKTTPKDKPGQSKERTDADEGTRGKGSEESGADDGEDGESDQGKTPELDDDGQADDDAEQDDEKEKDEVEEEDDDDKDDEGEPTEEKFAQQAKAELTKQGVTFNLDELPKEARPIVRKRLSEMTAAFTRAMMDARKYRSEEAAFRAERTFMEQHSEYLIAELLEKGGEDLEAKVNKLLQEANTDTARAALKTVTKDMRETVLKSINDQAAATERLNTRADEIEQYARASCRKLNVPFEIVEEAIANRLMSKPDDNRDLTETELDAIIGRQRNILRKHMGEKRIGQRKEEIRGRREDRRTTSPAAKGGSGDVAPGASTQKLPKNDEEFAAQFAAKIRSGTTSRR